MSALFNNVFKTENINIIISKTIISIMSHQCTIEEDLYKNNNIILKYLE